MITNEISTKGGEWERTAQHTKSKWEPVTSTKSLALGDHISMIWEPFLYQLFSRLAILSGSALFVVCLNVVNEGLASRAISYLWLTVGPPILLWFVFDVPIQMARDGVNLCFMYCSPAYSDHIQLILKRIDDFAYLMHIYNKLHPELPPYTHRFEGMLLKYADDIVFNPLTNQLQVGQETVESPSLQNLLDLLIQ